MQSAYDIEVLRPSELTPQRVERWRELQDGVAAFDSPYLSPGWSRAVEQVQGPRGPRVAVVRKEGRDVGFLPVAVAGHTAMPIGAPMCDYQALVAEPDLEVDARDLVGALGVDRFDFSHMLAERPPFAAYARGMVESRVVDMSGGYETYVAERKAAGVGLIKDCDRKRRRAARDVAEPVFTAYSRSEAAFDQMIAWKRAQFRATGQTDIFAAGWTLRLLKLLFASRDPDFGAVLFTLHFGDRLAAAQLNLRGRRTLHAWIIAYDPELERHSPGLLLFQDVLRWMDETPFDRLDLGPGDVRFKRELANAGTPIAHGFVGLPSTATLARAAVYEVRRAVESLPLGPVSELPGKAMRRLDQWRGLRGN
ncbi:MAG: GNAT family N-acetyltransferase [Phenylobacterium sp.]|jgi:CelD/BcsL family acetyltransferase involved in cellulose biosynthesis|uniref:GNAT family N-acetyltransferase n=1 Tax=Phenylobacterium sp. TaxID=1871053 RepID=UPI002A364552|nr:GNAT family N-acetyltransferase [Phenylobacterium sp.]MDX9997886.1 GNAT family N-acetyltransferase [Phenylobacterium sp.]